jgi:hypothetical protein
VANAPIQPCAGLTRAPGPRGPIFLFTFINSMGGSVVTSNALFFLTKQGFEFSQAMNFLLGSLLGVAYIAGALGAQPTLRWLRARVASLSTRGMMAALMVILAALCAVPQAAVWLSPDGSRSPGPVWFTVLAYSLGSGMLWPMVESYVSGGRSGRDLRSTMGAWNVVWSGAGLVITAIVAPFAKQAATLAIFAIGCLHVVSLAPLARLKDEPADHVEGEHEPHPPVYADLLVTFRFLLPLAYLVMSAVGSYLPSLADRLGLLRNWSLAGAAFSIGGLLPLAWVGARVAVFALLERWQAWHGRWSFAIWSGGLLLVGFAGIVLAGLCPPGIGVSVALAGLVAFGAAASAIYTAAIYYAMEVGKADVNAGGAHEALIGVGYMLGPGIGLGWTLAAERGALSPRLFEPAMLATVGVIACLVAAYVARRVARHGGAGGLKAPAGASQ